MNLKFVIFFICLFIVLVPSQALAKKSLSARFYIVNGDHRQVIVDEMNRFRRLYPDIDLDLQLYHGEEYSARVDQWLA